MICFLEMILRAARKPVTMCLNYGEVLLDHVDAAEFALTHALLNTEIRDLEFVAGSLLAEPVGLGRQLVAALVGELRRGVGGGRLF